MRDVALQLDVFANEEGKIIRNGNILSYFGISKLPGAGSDSHTNMEAL